jgi:AcrR family transcriptional regulator
MTASLRGLATRRRILDCAVGRFADQGFRQTSVAQVARDAGLTPPAVHAHFGSKEALFQAAFDEDVASLLSVIQTRLEIGALAGLAGVTPGRSLTLIPELVAAIEDHALVRRVFQGLEPDRTADLLNAPAVLATRQRLVATVRLGQTAGAVRADLEPVALAGALETLVLALLLGAVQIGVTEDGPRRAALAAIVIRGVFNPPGPS